MRSGLQAADNLKILTDCGGIPDYSDERDGVFEILNEAFAELQNCCLSAAEVDNLLCLLPPSLGSDFYGMTFILLNLLKESMNRLPGEKWLLGTHSSQWNYYLADEYPTRFILLN